jgi:WD40 repeat protein
VGVFDTRSLQQELRFATGALNPDWGFASALTFSPDGRALATVGHGDAVTLWDTRTWRARARLEGLHEDSQALDISPDGRLVAAADFAGTVAVWNLNSRTQVGGFQVPGQPLALAFSADSKRVAVTLGDLGTDIGDFHGQHVANLPTPDRVRAVAFSPDGRLMATGQANGVTQLRDARTAKPVGRPMQPTTGEILTVSFAPDSRTLATSSRDGSVRLWDVATQKPVGTPLPGEDNHRVSAAFTPDGAHLFTYYDNGDAFGWAVTPHAWARQACSTAGRNLTRSEWSDALPDRPFHAICPPG